MLPGTDARTLNNLGIAHNGADRPIHPVGSYQAASKLKNELASANLGRDAEDFADEADEIPSTTSAREPDRPDTNVGLGFAQPSRCAT